MGRYEGYAKGQGRDMEDVMRGEGVRGGRRCEEGQREEGTGTSNGLGDEVTIDALRKARGRRGGE